MKQKSELLECVRKPIPSFLSFLCRVQGTRKTQKGHQRKRRKGLEWTVFADSWHRHDEQCCNNEHWK